VVALINCRQQRIFWYRKDAYSFEGGRQFTKQGMHSKIVMNGNIIIRQMNIVGIIATTTFRLFMSSFIAHYYGTPGRLLSTDEILRSLSH
jgi:hypothetical protein